MRQLGFSVVVDSRRDNVFYEHILTDMLDAGITAIEVQLPEHDERLFDGKLLKLAHTFRYRAIHTSQLISPIESKEDIAYYQRAAKLLKAHALTIHPDLMQSWNWLRAAFGDLAQPENMDARKAFGTSAADMQQIRNVLPNARFTIDVNHLLTLVPSPSEALELATNLHETVPVGQYHLSGFEGFDEEQQPHAGLDKIPASQQEILFACIQDPSVPIILETRGWADLNEWRKDHVIARHYLQ